jgi:alpha-N-arabinofuranosidase
LDDANLGTFEWTDTIGDPDFRKPFQAWGGLQTMGAGLEEVVQLIQTIQAEPLICVRYEKKSPKDAADEVEYFNGSTATRMGALRAKNGHPQPYRIKYWQIGNERWGATYWKAVPEFGKAMLAVDPSIKLLSSFPSPELVKGAAAELSYVSPHQYDVENLGGTKQELEDTRKIIHDFGGGKNLKLAITEWNTTAGDIGLPRAKLWTLKNALDCARYQNLLHREADLVEIANRSNLTNSFCSGIIQTNRSGMFLAPTYYAQQLYSTLAGTVPLMIESEIPADMVPDVSATLSEDGKWLTLFAINTGPSAVRRLLDLSEVTSFGAAEVWTLSDTLGRDEPEVFNSFEEPTRVSPRKTKAVLTGGKGIYSFPAYSLTVLRVRAR